MRFAKKQLQIRVDGAVVLADDVRQSAADAQDGKFEFGCFGDEFHIQREGGVAGVIKRSAAGA